MAHITTFSNHGSQKQEVSVKFFDTFIALVIETEEDNYTHHLTFDQLMELERKVTYAVESQLEAMALAEFDARREDGEYAIN